VKILTLFVTSVVVSFVPAKAVGQKVEAKQFQAIPAGLSTYHWHKGWVLTSKGQVEDQSLDAMVHKAVAQEMSLRGFTESTGKDGLELSYMGGISAGIRTDSIWVGDYMTWATGDVSIHVDGRTYKKSSLIITVVDPVPNKAVWAARATDNFGQPSDLEQRVDRAVAKSFDKFPVKKK
jgi:Domain of unknown function (DUF4136)